MTTSTIWDSASSASRPGRVSFAARRLIAAGLAVLGVASVVFAERVRGFEATVAAVVVGASTRTDTYVWASRGSFYWGMGTDAARGLRITYECSLAYVSGPLLVIFAFLLLLKRLPELQVVAGAVAAVTFMLVVNTFRIWMIAMSVHIWDSETAFWWSHVVLGSLTAVVGNVTAMALGLRIAFLDQHPPKASVEA